MVSEKKPSIYSDRGTIGSVDELDEYGVWVKSEPQDMSPANTGEEFDDLSLPDFETDGAEVPAELGAIDDPYISEIDLSDAETAFGIPDSLELGGDDLSTGDDFDDFSIPANDSGEDGLVTAETAELELETDEIPDMDDERDRTDLSTQLLMKIAEELSSIRTELSSLKREFAGIRVEAPAGDAAEIEQHGGFFSEEDDEKIALTGDEMNNILNTADFTEEAGTADEPDAGIELIGADELETGIELTEEPEDTSFEADGFEAASFTEDGIADGEPAEPAASDAAEEEAEEIEIDFEDLGIDLNIDPADFDKAREADAGEQSLAVEEVTAEPSLADMAMDMAATDEFAGDVLGAIAEEELLAEEALLMEDGLPDEKPPEEQFAEENLFIEETVQEETAGTETDELTVTDEISLVDEFGDLDELQQFRSEGVEPMTPAPEDSSYLEEDPLTGASDDNHEMDLGSLDLSEAVIDEPDLSGEITENPVEEPLLDEISLDGLEDISIELEDEDTAPLSLDDEDAEPPLPVDTDLVADAGAEETLELSLATEDDSLAQVIPEGFEAEAAESPIPFDDDLEGAFDLTEDISASAELSEPSLESPLPDEFSLDTDDTGTAAPATGVEEPVAMEEPVAEELFDIPAGLKSELKTVLSYMDHLLESLPEEKIEEFAKSEYFDSYKKLFKELGLV